MALRLGVAMVALSSAGLSAQQPEALRRNEPALQMSYTCAGITGSSMAAPDWKSTQDGTSQQQLVLRYRGNREVAHASWTIRNETPYYEAVGLGVSMGAGFAIFVFAQDYVETYVYNAGTTELLYTAIRSGSTVLPNSIKSFRGHCRPGAAH